MAEKQPIGKVVHFFDKISVAVLSLTGDLKVGDTIEITTSEGPFQQTVDSMQVNHEKIESASTGDDVGLKVENPVKPGDAVAKVM